jgi:hypothetical protein
VGVTPFSGMVLPGERLIKLEAASHMPSEKKVEVPVRGRLSLNESLEKVPARIVLTGLPAGTSISIDGVSSARTRSTGPSSPAATRWSGRWRATCRSPRTSTSPRAPR